MAQDAPKAPPMAQDAPKAPPMAQDAPKAPPMAQDAPKAPPMAQDAPKAPPMAQDAPKAPPMKGRALYDDVSDALANFLPPKLRNFSSYCTSHNIKVWYGDVTREHYEVQ